MALKNSSTRVSSSNGITLSTLLIGMDFDIHAVSKAHRVTGWFSVGWPFPGSSRRPTHMYIITIPAAGEQVVTRFYPIASQMLCLKTQNWLMLATSR